MKKLCLLMLCAALFGCGKEISPQIKGNIYLLTDAPENMEITLGFDQNESRFFGRAVNNYFGSYKLEGNTIKFSAIGSTMMAAPEPMMRAETEYFNTLSGIDKISLQKDTLTLSGNGKTLVFRKSGRVSDQ